MTSHHVSHITTLHCAMLSLLLSSYHRRLGMILEALESYMDGGRVSHSWCMGVVSHGYGGLGVGKNGGGGWYVCETKPTGLGACQEMPEHFQNAG